MLGINLSGAEFGDGNKYGWDYVYPSLKDLTFYAQKGITLARLPVQWERLQPDLGGALDKAELGRLVQFLDNAAKTGVQVIVDVHNFGRYDGDAIGSKDVPIKAFADFWSKLASAIGDKDAVLGYDLMNEPHGMPSKTAWPDAAQAATDAIRALGDKHTIFVEGEGWAGSSMWARDNPLLDVHDPAGNLVYEAHTYFDHDGSGTYQGSYDEEHASPDIGVKRLESFVSWLEDKDAKGFIGEFGAPSDDPRWQVVLDHFLDKLNEYGLSGTYWGAGSWFNGYNVGLLDKSGNAKASLGTLLDHVPDAADIGVGAVQVVAGKGEHAGAATDGDDILHGTDVAGHYDGGAGIDTVDFSSAKASVNARLDGVHFISIEALIGGAGNDSLTGNSGANRLTGGAGGDWLDGGAGADTLIGGAGDDTYVVDDARDQVTERVGEGRDHVDAAVSWTLGTSVEDLTLTGSAVRGTGNQQDNVLTGNAAGNVLTGLDGNDVLEGGAGADTLIGGKGNDLYHVDSKADVIVEQSGQGTDTVVATLDWMLGEQLENLTMTGSGSLTGTGNGGKNTLVGNAGVSILYGMDGDDFLYGGTGNDRLEGGRDDDHLDGGSGDDILIGGTGHDWLTGGAGRDRFTFVSKDDTKNSGMDRVLDFKHGEDVLDLSAVDANSRAEGNQSFSFIGDRAFGHHAGELRYDMRDGYTVVEGDLNGDGHGDFVFRIDLMAYRPTASDFHF